MKNIIFLLLISLNAGATDYYFATGGNDLNTGTSAGAPWQTIAKFNFVFASKLPGDRFLFNRGDVFYGNMIISRSGSAGSPITIGAYGIGAKPIITGFTDVTAWTNLGSNIWESTPAISALSTCRIVTIAGMLTAVGRIPNTGFYTYQTFSTNVSITSSSVNSGVINWTGAEAVIKKNNYTLDRTTITNHSGNTLTYTDPAGSDIAKNNYGFFIQNDVRTLDSQNEWYYNPTTKKIRIYSTTSPTNVKATTISDVVTNVGFDYIIIDNLNLTGANHDLISFTSTTDFCTIQNCTLNFAGNDGIETIAGTLNLINLNTISNCGKAGIFKLGSNSTITNNTIINSGIVAGISDNEAQGDGIFFNDLNVLVQYNTVRNSGSHGIYCSGPSWSVKNNFVDSSVLLLNDLGGIYTAANGGVNRLIDHNIVLNTIGNTSGTTSGNVAEGIYLDEIGSGHVVVSNNTVANSGNSGIKVHKSQFNKIRDNTVYNNTGYQIYLQNEEGTARIFSDTLKNNIFFSKTATQWCLGFISITNDIASMGVSDSNYFARPIDDNITFQTYQTNTNYVNRTLATWKSFTGLDTHSNKSPVTISDVNDLRFEYNETGSPKTVSLGGYNYIDVKSTNYPGTITLAPYTSAVLIKQSAVNIAPTANAGTDGTITSPTSNVSLFGIGTDADGTIVSYSWTKILGGACTITTPSSASTTVTGLVAAGVYQFQLTVTDNNGATATDVIQITVNAANIAPTANAGPDQLISASSSILSGSGSDLDGTISSYSWTKTLGGSATITSPASAITTVTELSPDTYQFTLTVTDNNGATSTDSITVTVSATGTIIRNFIIIRNTIYK